MIYIYVILILLIIFIFIIIHYKKEHFTNITDDENNNYEEDSEYNDSENNDNIKSDVIYALKNIDKILNKHNIWYVSAYGTLLGGIRHWDMIPWDDDGDLLVLRKDVNKIMNLKEEFKKNGLILEQNWKLIKVYMNDKKYPFIDLFINEDDNGKFLRCMEPYDEMCNYPDKNMEEHNWWWKWVGYPTEWVMERKRIKFHNYELWAPIESLKLLQFWYGNDVLTVCKTPEYDHITGNYIEPKTTNCNNLPKPQL